MGESEILKCCVEKGILLDRDVLNFFNDVDDTDSVRFVLEKIKSCTSKKFITKDIFNDNKNILSEAISYLPEEKQQNLERIKVKLGLNIEIEKEYHNSSDNSYEIFNSSEEINNSGNIKIKSQYFFPSKKLGVPDFVKYFRSRFVELRNILQERSELSNLVSINKISGSKQGVSLIGIVSDKNITKNKNLIFEIEDLTGKIKVLISNNKKELYEKASEIPLDSVIAFKCSGNREIVFANDIIYPDSFLPERKRAEIEEYALFIGDLHIGSKHFMEDKFLKFIDYLNGKMPNTPEVRKIKYIFIVGDLIAGVGAFPGQEFELDIGDLESQFSKAAELLKKIPKSIKIVFSPGNHDGVRLMEPQPIIDEKYAWPLYELDNLIVTTNPGLINFASRENFNGFDVLMYHGFSYFYYADNVNSLILEKAAHKPELIMKYLLQYRHLAPTHSSTQYFPSENDSHLIKNIPDIFVSGHVHKSGVSYYNNILIVSVSTWEAMTPYMEKVGADPDFCKVPMLNLKTRAVKILDFE